jgi:hypothetical protein
LQHRLQQWLWQPSLVRWLRPPEQLLPDPTGQVLQGSSRQVLQGTTRQVLQITRLW